MSAIDHLLVLYSERSEAVTTAVLAQAALFGCDVLPLSAEEMLREVRADGHWHVRGQALDPARTAVINRLGSLPGTDAIGERRLWVWLRQQLARFAYASALPSATSPLGGYGSLLDQWTDLPLLAPGLRVPTHRRRGESALPAGDVRAIEPDKLYSLGQPVPSASAAPASLLAYAKPDGLLVIAAQAGGMLMLVNAPPDMPSAHAGEIDRFAARLAQVSESRILEHAFFVGARPPVFYSTYPIPVVSASDPQYAAFVVQGLIDDIARRSRRALP